MTKTTSTVKIERPVPPSCVSHDDYQPMLRAVYDHFALHSIEKGPLFTTDMDGKALWNAWLTNLPRAEWQHHDCHACRQFVERYGNLVAIDEHGVSHSAVFGEAPGIYAQPNEVCALMVEASAVTGVFVNSHDTLGTPKTKDGKRAGVTWYHMHAVPAQSSLWKGKILTAPQRAAELLEDHGTLCRALAEYSAETVKTALGITEADALYRGEKIAGRLRWLAELQATPKARRAAAVWRAVATAPAGFCHIKSSVVGSLLDDIAGGASFEQVKRSFDAKMHPLQYQRPTAAPTEGNIAQAEKIVEKLGIAPSLARRFARLEDLVTMWEPRIEGAPSKLGGVFDHLKNMPPAGGMVARAPVMTWEKFAREVLPNASALTVLVPSHAAFHALVTAADYEAPPIIQWDNVGQRNPVTWYTYSGGSTSYQWGLVAGKHVRVTAVTAMPNKWQPGHDHHGEGVMLLLEGCVDSRNEGSSLFPELLKSELHAVRATIEAHSRRTNLTGAAEASACGLAIRKGSNQAALVIRATVRGVTTEYTVDRWD